MEYQQGQDREQLTLYSTCLDDMVPDDNSVRFIDQFVETLDLENMGFTSLAAQGRPPYSPGDLLKLYIYGYMNRMRSSRQLEKECHRNLEVIWLLKNLKPDHNTIARFRKNNSKAIRRVFRESVSIARNFNLIGGELIAGDSTKLRAQNSKKNNYNKKKVQRHLDHIDEKLAAHNKALAEADNDKKAEIEKEIAHRKAQRGKYEQIQKELNENTSTENPQLSTSDPDSRHQIVRGMITEVCYTAQTTVDAKHKLLVDYKLSNQNDKKAMGMMLRRAKSILRTGSFTALYDKGYHTGSEFHIADQLGIKTLVAIPAIGRKSQAPDPAYNAEHFTYNSSDDTYTCPQGHRLTSNGTRYKGRNYTFKQYKTRACKQCPVRDRCTRAKANGKVIQRSQFTQNIQNNAQRVRKNESLYKKRQALVEHPYGTLKRQWGFDHILTKKGIMAASADFGLMAIAYNLKRILKLSKENKLDLTALKNAIYHLEVLLDLILNCLGARKSNFQKMPAHRWISPKSEKYCF
ncbi:IS1182 family transposase [Marixanthomonas spongiae]|uniref:IS1182 family transposase n=1 Tax=Marixanthomonas spongiae TaxID=2174845 RepID=UPI001F0C2909|nr:IS1182 family transposase [Marixanthomonas spongiae]